MGRNRRVAVRVVLAASLLVGCKPKPDGGRPQVAVSIFPLFDMARRIAGDRLEVVLVLPPGRSEHSYDPSPREMAGIARARLAISIGLGMDTWLERMVRGAAGSGVRMVQLGTLADPRPIGQEMIGDEAADEVRQGTHDEHEHAPGAPDPHVWLDPLRATHLVDGIVDALSQFDTEGAAGFRARGAEVKRSLSDLNSTIEQRARTWSRRTIVTFHGSMRYFADRYGLKIAAVLEPFPGKEPTAKYLVAVLSAIQKTQAAALFSEPQLDKRPAKAVAEQAHLPLFELDPIGGLAGTDSYERLLLHDTDVLEQALR
jgi:zinc transport system substrate-binding protein